ncbi:MAG: hydroxyethylthiazole kinase [Gammaproteobacteria bacterium]
MAQSIETTIAQGIEHTFTQLRKTTPLIHNVTNLVVMPFSANALLAAGASPLMAHAEEELEDILALAQACILNIGTLDPQWIKAMKTTLSLANQLKIPVVLDPVGAGATPLRTYTAMALLEQGIIAILRGNAGEILALGGKTIKSKGVDSLYGTHAAVDAAQALAQQFKTTVVISGAEDIIVDGTGKRPPYLLQNGDTLMTKIAGTGCIASAINAACAAVCKDSYIAAITAMTMVGISGEQAAAKSKGPGSFLPAFLDELYQLTTTTLLERIKGHELTT